MTIMMRIAQLEQRADDALKMSMISMKPVSLFAGVMMWSIGMEPQEGAPAATLIGRLRTFAFASASGPNEKTLLLHAAALHKVDPRPRCESFFTWTLELGRSSSTSSMLAFFESNVDVTALVAAMSQEDLRGFGDWLARGTLYVKRGR